MVRVELAKRRDDAAVQIANDMVTDADGECLPHGKWARCVDYALDELMHTHNNQLTIGAGRHLADMIKNGMRLIRVAGAEDCKH